MGRLGLTPASASVYGWASFGDHTSGNGQMLLANGATVGGLAVFEETVFVKPYTTYVLSFWAANVDPTANSVSSELAQIEAHLQGAPQGTPLQVELTAGAWVHFSGSWTSNSDSQTLLSIFDVNLSAANNDFALDDISLTGCE